MRTTPKKPFTALRENPPSWIHYMCFRCWTNLEENVVYSRDGKEVLGVYLPEGKYRVPGMKIYICCSCGGFCRQPSWYVEKPPNGPFCDHDENGAVFTVEALYRNRGISTEHPPSSLRELLES